MTAAEHEQIRRVLENCDDEDECVIHIATDPNLTPTEKGFYLAAIKAMTRVRDRQADIDAIISKHVADEEKFWQLQDKRWESMKPVIEATQRWNDRRKWATRIAIALAAILAWSLDVFHHIVDVLRGFHNKP